MQFFGVEMTPLSFPFWTFFQKFRTKIYRLEYKKSAMKFFGSEMTPPPPPFGRFPKKHPLLRRHTPQRREKLKNKLVRGLAVQQIFHTKCSIVRMSRVSNVLIWFAHRQWHRRNQQSEEILAWDNLFALSVTCYAGKANNNLKVQNFQNIWKIYGEILKNIGDNCKGRVRLPKRQGPTGRCFQLRDGSGSGIGKNFGFGFGYGSGSGIGTVFLINRVSSGIQNLERVFFSYIPNTAFAFKGYNNSVLVVFRHKWWLTIQTSLQRKMYVKCTVHIKDWDLLSWPPISMILKRPLSISMVLIQIEETIGIFYGCCGNYHHWMFFGTPTIDINGFSMVFGWFHIWFQWFSMVQDHWSNDEMVSMDRYTLNPWQMIFCWGNCIKWDICSKVVLRFETHKKDVNSTILGGCLREKVTMCRLWVYNSVYVFLCPL